MSRQVTRWAVSEGSPTLPGEIPAATTESRASVTAAGSGYGGAADAAGHALHRSRRTSDIISL